MEPETEIRGAWADANRRAEASGGGERVEHYPAGDTADLAMRLHREGLIFRINRAILHPLGLALGVAGDIDRETMQARSVYALTLHDTGMEYTAEQIERNERKLREAGHADH